MQRGNHEGIADQLLNSRGPLVWHVDAVLCFLVIHTECKKPGPKFLYPVAITATVVHEILVKVGLSIDKSFVTQKFLELPDVLGNLPILDFIVASAERAIL